tara:strand:- start:530 stop:1108 length:579 start_codon:yes stop_codon:yes gene_type:complete
MLKKFFILINLFQLFSFEAYGAEEGMPQLNPEYWVSQIFWLIVVFTILYLILSKFILPKINRNLETRKSQILRNLEDAQKFKEESEKKIKDYETIINEAKQKAKSIINDTKKKINDDIQVKKNHLEKEIESEINKAENEIKSLKLSSVDSVKKIAFETSSLIIKEILNADLNNSNVSAIVEDVSKKKLDKYL